jgi:polysaccharide chain length determinant protein (PEP-CTERM system associated)
MINTERIFSFENYLKIGLRRKWYIIIPLILSVIISFGVYKYLPKEYRASTLILVRAQQVPERYVQATLTEPVTERLNTISQEILSRTRLERIIKEFNLYSDLLNKSRMEEIVEMMRRKIDIKVQEESGFSISFEGRDPGTVMTVTNKLASMFIEENLKSRESRVEGTAQFINRELKTVESTLRKKEDMLRRYKEKNMGQLPEQLEANLRIIAQLQEQLKTTNDALRAKEDRMVVLQNQIEQAMDQRSQRGQTWATLSATGIEDPLAAQLNALKKELEDAEDKYTGYHPDVANLKKKIAALTLKLKKQEEEKARRLGGVGGMVAGSNPVAPSPEPDPTTEELIAQHKEQFSETQSEVRGLKEEIVNLKEEIALYQKRIQETPKKEQEMVNLNRDYNLMMGQFQSLLNKKYDAQLAENLERKQQSEQFMVLDPARLPEKPSKPNRNGLLAMGALMGLGIGLGLTWFRESMDRSFYEVSDVETYLKLPVVATLLNLNEEEKKAA